MLLCVENEVIGNLILYSYMMFIHAVLIYNSTIVLIRTTIERDKLASNSCHERTMHTNSL